MSHWVFWEWVAYTGLFIAACILAMDMGVKVATSKARKYFKFIEHPLWAFAPLFFVVASTGILLAHEFGLIGSGKKLEFTWQGGVPHIVVPCRLFINEQVILDDRIYRNCTFENVTFMFNGTAPFELTGNHINGRMAIATENPAVESTVMWLRGLGAENIDVDPATGMLVVPPKRINPIFPSSPSLPSAPAQPRSP
jgi:hypothetical protein